ncbi:MAG: tetratricopeptide repeat protein [Chloroflexi bacterium]|nr:tetratricopeptide repeat protein [Chloroflexota bacterium]
MGTEQRPSGTVTFLFTDVEGSTRLWEQHRTAMAAALARHYDLLGSAVEQYRGYVFKTVGDAVCAAFNSASDALDAAVAAQRALVAESWGDVDSIRVRMALHSGAAQERDGDYFGQPLNRVARLLALGHGGQILLSLVTEQLVQDSLPDGVSLRNLGQHSLKDQTRPERIFQVVAPGIPAIFPALKAHNARLHNLPVQSTVFIGRAREVEAVRRRLLAPDMRLLTLTGPGGTGKTRLGLQAAAGLVDAFEAGAVFVPLEPIREPELVPVAIAQALGVREEPGRPRLESVAAQLRVKQLLLLLDNFEQVTAAGQVVVDLLEACPHLKVLVTSREALRVYGEREYPVPPLAVPDSRHLPPESPERLAALEHYDAMQLFVERALDVRPDFCLTSDNAADVAEICRRLDGLPLAIELAAARIKLLSPAAILARLDRRLSLLVGGARDLPARQRALRDLIRWSYDLLDTEEQRLFQRLGGFRGGCTLEGAEAVCAGSRRPGAGDRSKRGPAPNPYHRSLSPEDVLDVLGSLVDKSLLRHVETADGEPRFFMLETIHEFAREQLTSSGEAEAIGRQHVVYFVTLAERAQPHLHTAEQVSWLNRLETEHDNFRAALKWCEVHKDWERGLRLAAALAGFWLTRGHLREGRTCLERLLAASDLGEDTEARAHALNLAGILAAEHGDGPAAQRLLDESASAWRRLGNQGRLVGVLINLGTLAYRQGDFPAARALLEEGLPIYRELGNTLGVAHALNNLGAVARAQHDFGTARDLLEESLAIKRALGDGQAIANTLSNLGAVAAELGDDDSARRWYLESLAIRQDVGNKAAIAESIEGLAGIAASLSAPVRALRLASAAAALREASEAPLRAADRAVFERWLSSARVALDARRDGRNWCRAFATALSRIGAQAAAALTLTLSQEERGHCGQGMRELLAQQPLLFGELLRQLDGGGFVVGGELAVEDEGEEIVFNRANPWPGTLAEERHQLVAVERALELGHVLALQQFAAAPLELGGAQRGGADPLGAVARHVGAGELDQVVQLVAGFADQPAHRRIRPLAIVRVHAQVHAHQLGDALDHAVVEVQPAQDPPGDALADLVVTEEVHLAVVSRLGCGLADVMQQRRPPQHEVGRNVVDDAHRVLEDVFVMERALADSTHRQQFGNGVRHQSEVGRQPQADRGLGNEQDLVELFGDALAADALEVGRSRLDGLARARVDREPKLGDKPHGAQQAERVLAEALGRVSDGTDYAALEVFSAAVRVVQLAGEHVDRHHVDREVSARQVLLERCAELDRRLARPVDVLLRPKRSDLYRDLRGLRALARIRVLFTVPAPLFACFARSVANAIRPDDETDRAEACADVVERIRPDAGGEALGLGRRRVGRQVDILDGATEQIVAHRAADEVEPAVGGSIDLGQLVHLPAREVAEGLELLPFHRRTSHRFRRLTSLARGVL